MFSLISYLWEKVESFGFPLFPEEGDYVRNIEKITSSNNDDFINNYWKRAVKFEGYAKSKVVLQDIKLFLQANSQLQRINFTDDWDNEKTSGPFNGICRFSSPDQFRILLNQEWLTDFYVDDGIVAKVC